MGVRIKPSPGGPIESIEAEDPREAFFLALVLGTHPPMHQAAIDGHMRSLSEMLTATYGPFADEDEATGETEA